ncbi:hypothetical protein R8Z50_21155 [Longispora sp. K20-0274]|uniref:hypothetical protein n=1 Tax=Longispora sp. K20-0274 TaxID=3088255 RepID=UPI00399BE4AD
MRRWTVTVFVWPAAAALVGGAVWLIVSPAFVAGTEQSRPLPPARTRSATPAPAPTAAPLAQVRPRESPTPPPRPTPSPTLRSDGPDTVVRVVYTDGGTVTLTYDHGKVSVTSVEPYDPDVRVRITGDHRARATVRLDWLGHLSTVEAYWEKPGVTKADVYEEDVFEDGTW